MPIYADNWGKKPIDRNKFLLDTIEKLLKKSDIEEIINAGDPDDEGQYLIDEILEYFNNKKPVKRLLINDPTIGGIKNSFNNIKDNKEYEPLGRSAAARAVSDNLLGINLSRYFTLKNKVGTLSIGRVQTPTLAMIVNRDNAIKKHVKEKYYEFFANMQVIKNDENLKEIDNLRDIVNKNFCDKNLINEYLNNLENNYKNLEDKHIYRFKYILPSSKAEEFPDKKIKNKSYFEEIDKKLQEQNMKITVTKQFLKENPPLPFNLMKLQVYCSNKFNYSPDDVMKITQNLRDSYNAITYNRSVLKLFPSCSTLIFSDLKYSTIAFATASFSAIINFFIIPPFRVNFSCVVGGPTPRLHLKKITQKECYFFQALKFFML